MVTAINIRRSFKTAALAAFVLASWFPFTAVARSALYADTEWGFTGSFKVVVGEPGSCGPVAKGMTDIVRARIDFQEHEQIAAIVKTAFSEHFDLVEGKRMRVKMPDGDEKDFHFWLYSAESLSSNLFAVHYEARSRPSLLFYELLSKNAYTSLIHQSSRLT